MNARMWSQYVTMEDNQPESCRLQTAMALDNDWDDEFELGTVSWRDDAANDDDAE